MEKKIYSAPAVTELGSLVSHTLGSLTSVSEIVNFKKQA